MDPYVYPETNVLRNLRDIRDAGQLNKFEAIATTRRMVELEHEPVQGRFNARHLQAIHHHIFQDVCEWAGDFRTVSISKSGDLERFASRGAYYLGEINAIHPFREGNGRTQREFIGELGLKNGWMIDWRQVSREEMIEASRRSLRIDNAELEQVLRKALDNEPNRKRGLERGQAGIERGR